jgi:hypothetical protein
MGTALKEISEIIKQKVDILGTDACLMAMAEVGSEIADSTKILLGSEEVEPAAGWPYDQLMAEWQAAGSATPEQVAKILTSEYVKSYQGGQNGTMDVALSSLDLEKLGELEAAISKLGEEIAGLSVDARKAVLNTIRDTQNFAYSDYGDVVDFVSLLRKNKVGNLSESTLNAVEKAAIDMVISNDVTEGYKRAKGIAMWLPAYKSTHDMYSASYAGLKFHAASNWGTALQKIFE